MFRLIGNVSKKVYYEAEKIAGKVRVARSTVTHGLRELRKTYPELRQKNSRKLAEKSED